MDPELPDRPRRRWPWIVAAIALVFVGLIVKEVIWALVAEPGKGVNAAATMKTLVLDAQGADAATPNAWPSYVKACERYDALMERVKSRVGPRPSGTPADSWPVDFNAVRDQDAPATTTAEAEAALRDARELGLFDALAEVLKGGCFVRPIPDDTPLLLIELPDLKTARSLSALNCARMRLALQRGDVPERDAAFEQTLAIARVLSHQSTAIERLVGLAIKAAALEELRFELAERSHTDAELAALAAIMQRQQCKADITLALQGERQFVLDLINRTHTDDGNGGGRFLPSEAATIGGGRPPEGLKRIVNASSIVFASKRTTVDHVNRYFRSLEQWSKLSPKVRSSQQTPFEQAMREMSWQDKVLKLVLPPLESLVKGDERARTSEDATRLAIALERFRVASGRYPTTLGELVPAYIADVPLDSTTGGPLIYRVSENGYTLYSVGNDGEDNGGVELVPPTSNRNEPAKGDTLFRKPRPSYDTPQ